MTLCISDFTRALSNAACRKLKKVCYVWTPESLDELTIAGAENNFESTKAEFILQSPVLLCSSVKTESPRPLAAKLSSHPTTDIFSSFLNHPHKIVFCFFDRL